MGDDRKKKRIDAGLHVGKCRICGAKTRAADPYWLVRCPDC